MKGFMSGGLDNWVHDYPEVWIMDVWIDLNVLFDIFYQTVWVNRCIARQVDMLRVSACLSQQQNDEQSDVKNAPMNG